MITNTIHTLITGMGAAISYQGANRPSRRDQAHAHVLMLVVMADGALLYRRAKIKVAMSQTEMVATVLNEGVQSAHAQIPYFTWAKGDTLQDQLKNAGYDLMQKYTTNEFAIRMPAEYPGARQRIAKVVALVGDSKWLWSVFGVVQNWARPVASGPFTTAQVCSDRFPHTHARAHTLIQHIIFTHMCNVMQGKQDWDSRSCCL